MHSSSKLDHKALRFYETILNRFPESDRRIDDAFLSELAVIAKECGISGKELATILNEDAHVLRLRKKC